MPHCVCIFIQHGNIVYIVYTHTYFIVYLYCVIVQYYIVYKHHMFSYSSSPDFRKPFSII